MAGGSVCAQVPNVPAAEAPAPDAHIEFFGAENGYATARDGIVFLCVVRNVGTAPLPENALRVRLFVVSGLDYTNGELTPNVPTLARNQAVAFRWRLTPKDDRTALVAGAMFETIGATTAAPVKAGTQTASAPPAPPNAPATPKPSPAAPRALLTVVPRFGSAPRIQNFTGEGGATPLAGATAEQAWVGNDRVGVRIWAAEKRIPVLRLFLKEGTSWRSLAASASPGQVRAGELGQKPWWETFRWQSARVINEKDSATLTLLGTIESDWRAELTLISQRGTAAMNGRLRLTAMQTMQLYGLQLPTFLAESDSGAAKADGLPVSVNGESFPLGETARLAAARLRDITFGLTWPSTYSLNGWHTVALPGGDTDRARLLGALAETEATPTQVEKGRSVEFAFRLYVLQPSADVRDALRFLLP